MTPRLSQGGRRQRQAGRSASRARILTFDGIIVTNRQHQFLAALVSAPSIAAACADAGVTERSAHRWLSGDTEFGAALAEARRQALAAATSRLQGAAAKAVGCLEAVMDDPQAPVPARVSAARSVLDFAFRSAADDQEARLTALEEQLAALVGRNGKVPHA